MKKGVKKKEINVESVLRKNLPGLSLKEIVKETGFSEEEVKRRLKNLKSKNKIKVKGILNKKYFYLELDKKEEINKKLEKGEEKNVGSLNNKKELLKSDALLNMLEDLEKEKENSRKSEELFRSLVETSPDCIKLFDLNGNLKFINKGGLDEHGLKSSSDAIKSGWKAIDTIVKEDKGKFLGAIKDAKKGKTTTFEIRHTPEGSNREICLETIAPVKNFRGKVRGIFGVSRDLTTLKRSEEKYKALYLSSKDAIMILSPPDWNFSSGNPSAIKLFGVKDEKEFIFRGPGEYSPKKQPDGELSSVKAKEMIERAMREGSNFFEWTHKRINGEEFLATVLLTKVQIGKKKFLQATVRDISFKKEIENKLKESEERYRKLFENAGISIVVFDEIGNLLMANKSFLKLIKYTKNQIKNKSTLFKLIFPSKFVLEKVSEILNLAYKREIKDFVFPIKTKDNITTLVSSNINVLKDGFGKVTGEIFFIKDLREIFYLEDQMVYWAANGFTQERTQEEKGILNEGIEMSEGFFFKDDSKENIILEKEGKKIFSKFKKKIKPKSRKQEILFKIKKASSKF